MLMYNRALIEKLGMTEDDCYRLSITHIDSMSNKHGMVQLDSFLLPDDSHLIQDMINRPDTAELPPDDTGDADPMLWPKMHCETAQSKGLTWWKPSPITQSTRDAFPGLSALGERQLDILTTAGVGFPETETRLIESSQRVDRVTVSSASSTSVKCVIPRMQRWVTSRCRMLHGVEALALQGLVFKPGVISHTPNNMLFQLAGNAFHAGCSALATLTVFATLAVGSHLSSRVPSPLKETTAATVQDGIDDVDMDDLLGGCL